MDVVRFVGGVRTELHPHLPDIRYQRPDIRNQTHLICNLLWPAFITQHFTLGVRAQRYGGSVHPLL